MIINLDTPPCIEVPCEPFTLKWSEWCLNHNRLALLPLSKRYRSDFIDRKSRAMIKKANKEHSFAPFEWNSYLDDIYDINTSTPHRQGKVMTPAYNEYPSLIRIPWSLCESTHSYKHIGAFSPNGTLRAYCALAVIGEIAILNTIIGHYADKSRGLINGLIDYLVTYLLNYHPECKYLNYLDMENCGRGLHDFKHSVGFRSEQVQYVN